MSRRRIEMKKQKEMLRLKAECGWPLRQTAHAQRPFFAWWRVPASSTFTHSAPRSPDCRQSLNDSFLRRACQTD
jgi:hypothetical protein